MKTVVYAAAIFLFIFVIVAYCVAESHDEINNGMEPCLMNPRIECGSSHVEREIKHDHDQK